MTKDRSVFIIGGVHHNTLGVIRSLGERGIKPVVLFVTDDIKRRAYVSKSKYIEKSYIYISYDEAVDYLLSITQFKKKGDPKDVIICCSDGASSAVDNCYDKLSVWYQCPNARTTGGITKMMSKEAMGRIAASEGLQVPPSWIIDSNTVSQDIEFPCIIKPLYSIKGSKDDIHVFETKEDLQTYLSSESHSELLQAQKFIDKDYEYQLIGCSLNNGEHVVIPGVSHIIRPAKTTNTGYLRYEPIAKDNLVLNKTIEFVKRTGYSGLFSVEFLKGKDGIDYFMEINFRNDGNAICVTAAGVNLPYIWYLNAIGQDYTMEIKDIKPVFVMPEFDDMAQMFHRKVSFFQWLRDIYSTDCFMEFDRRDRKPFYYRVLDMLGVAFRKFTR